MEENSDLPPESEGYGGTEAGDTICFVQDAEGALENHGTVLDERAIQQLVESGAVGEDSIIAIVQNENGEPQTVVLSKQEAEALGIQIDSSESAGHHVAAPVPMESEDLVDEASDPVIDELKAVIGESAAPALGEFEDKTHTEPAEGTNLSNFQLNDQPGSGRQEDQEALNDENQALLDSALGNEHKDLETDEKNTFDEKKQEVEGTEEGAIPDSDVLSSIIQSLFNPNDINAANVSLVPKIIGGKRKLCLRVPTSTASALLAQSGSPFVTSLHEGGVPKKIKIVIPPSAVSSLSSAATLKSPLTKPELVSSQASGSKAAKPFLQSLFSIAPTSTNTAATTTSSVSPSASKTPIQLVQEGTTFRSLQPLTSEQLKHIANVLKQDRESILSGEPTSSEKRPQGTPNVIYDKSSNRKIVYRVVQSGDETQESIGASPANSSGRGRGRRGRPPKYMSAAVAKKAIIQESEPETTDEDAGSGSGLELSKEERDDKKRSLQRTRSGRVSKPPRHMMKDYKRLHYLDFAQPDLDDSDGGYSDYQDKDEGHSMDADMDVEEKSKPSSPIPSSPFHCTTCKKEYTTPHRLGRHYEQFPSHGTVSAGMRSAMKELKDDEDAEGERTLRGRGAGRGSGRGRGRRPRGRPRTISPSVQAERQRIRLAEALEASRDEDIVDVAGPRLAAAMSSWEFLLLRVQQEDEGNSKAALVPRILKEAAGLMGKITAVATEYLSASKTAQSNQSYELKDPKVAALVGLPCGTYYSSKDERRLLRDPLMLDDNEDEDSQDAEPKLSGTKPELAVEPVSQDMDKDKLESTVDDADVPAESEKLVDNDHSMAMQAEEPMADVAS